MRMSSALFAVVKMWEPPHCPAIEAMPRVSAHQWTGLCNVQTAPLWCTDAVRIQVEHLIPAVLVKGPPNPVVRKTVTGNTQNAHHCL